MRKRHGEAVYRTASPRALGGANAYEEAFQMDANEWDQQFDRYLRDRFKPFRDKERPADYGRKSGARSRQDRIRPRLLLICGTHAGEEFFRLGRRPSPRIQLAQVETTTAHVARD